MIDYTNYKKFYTAGDEYNVAILNKDITCTGNAVLLNTPTTSGYTSTMVYSVDGYVSMLVGSYYVSWEAYEDPHGNVELTYNEAEGRLETTVEGVEVYWGPVYEGGLGSTGFTYDPVENTLNVTLSGIDLFWSVDTFIPTAAEIELLGGELAVGVGTLNEQYIPLVEEGTNFTGLVEIKDGIARTFYTQQLLEPKRVFSTDLALADYTYDRLVDDTVNLPYSLSQVLFEANDYLTYNLFKDRLKKLHLNNTYVFSRMFIPNNDLPASNNVRYLGVPPSSVNTTTYTSSAASLTLFDKAHQTIKLSKADNFTDLGNITKYVSVKYAENTDTFVIFGISDTKFISLSTDLNTTNYIEVTTKYESEENELTFGKLHSICLNSNHIFITDYDNNNIIKYEVAGFYNKDAAFANRRNFIEVLGGTGNSTDPSRFKGPSNICCNDNYIVVYDAGNYTCKIFNTQFNYIKRLSGPPFKREPLAAMEFDVLENRLYVLTYFQDGLKLYIYDNNFILQEKHILEEKLSTIGTDKETVINIAFAKTSNNYWYICTNFNIFQKLKNRPEKILGRYQSERLKLLADTLNPEVTYIWNFTHTDFDKADFWWNFNDTTTPSINALIADNRFKGMGVINNYNDQDDIILLTDSRIYAFKEPYIFKSVTKYNTYPNYGATKLTVNRDEYIQTITINKELYKILNDIYTLKNNLIGRFTGNYDAAGVFTLEDYNYNINLSEFSDTDINQYYIHENEKAILGVINRAFKSVYELQVKLIELTAVDYGTNLKPVYNTQEGTLILE